MRFTILTVLLLRVFWLVAQPGIPTTVEDQAQNYIKKRKNVGLVIGVLQGDFREAYGYGRMAGRNAPTPDGQTLFEIGGLTTVFTGTLATRLEKQGAFSFQEKIQPYLESRTEVPAYQPQRCVEIRLPGQAPIRSCSPDPLADEVCINFCDLASHSSGLACSDGCWYTWNPFVDIEYEEKQFTDIGVEELFLEVANLELEAAPGYEFRYSNIGMAMLGHLLADMQQTTYDSLLQKELLIPLHLSDTRLYLTTPQQVDRLATGHNDRGRPVPPWNFVGMAPAAGLKSTADDLLDFLYLQMHPPDSEWQKVFQTARQPYLEVKFPGLKRLTHTGYGWLISLLSESSNRDVFWMNGGTGGFRAFMGMIPGTQTAVVVLSNNAQPVDDIGWAILEALGK